MTDHFIEDKTTKVTVAVDSTGAQKVDFNDLKSGGS
jgi:hypothetical protein